MANHAETDGEIRHPTLEDALHSLGRQVAYPPTPDIASSVRATLESAARDDRQHVWRPHRPESLLAPAAHPWPRVFASACLAIVAAACIALTAAALAGGLQILGVQITWLERIPRTNPVGATLALGQQMTIEEATAAAAFMPLEPTHSLLAATPAIYLSGSGADAMISFVYPATPDLPAAGESAVGALLTQFAGRTERPLIEKGLLDPNGSDASRTDLEPVMIHGEPGFWITGAPHAVFFVCSGAGECRQEPYRLAGDVLLWVQDGVTLRLESGLPKETAVAIAESVRRVDEPA